MEQAVTAGDASLPVPLASGHNWLFGTFDHSEQDPWGHGRVSFLDGALDEVRVYGRALTAAEVQALISE